MRPVFRDLANPELLKKCLHGGTQNPNESVNNVIWSRVPKKTFVQLEVLSLGTYDAPHLIWGMYQKLEILRKCVLSLVITRYRRWSASTNRGCYMSKNTIVYKKQRKLEGKKKRLKRKKEDDELLKNADDLEYGWNVLIKSNYTLKSIFLKMSIFDVRCSFS
ncbi:uncharacterized protein TNCV_4269121 [Trichonephila clavipes]|nr:uncharacterized protein TNCV_4269121 [Trichonephila clavipes]